MGPSSPSPIACSLLQRVLDGSPAMREMGQVLRMLHLPGSGRGDTGQRDTRRLASGIAFEHDRL
jgi:hypothetical protein